MKHRERVNISHYLQRLLQQDDTEIIYVTSKKYPQLGIRKFVRICEDIEWKIGFENDTEAGKGDFLYVPNPEVKFSSIEEIKLFYDIVDKPGNKK